MTTQLHLLVTENQSRTRSTFGRLDETTKTSGRKGVRQARAALAEASRRAQARDEARRARRDKELAERAARARSGSGHAA